MNSSKRGMLISVVAATDIAEFLTSRRERITPEQVGLPSWDPRRVMGTADDGLTISVYSAEPGSRSAQQLDLLASWTATTDRSPTTADD